MSGQLNNQFKWTIFVESRQGLYDDALDRAADYEYILTDIASFISYKIVPGQSLNAGYTQRHRGGALFHRLTQQYTIATLRDNYRLGHRIATDQTFSSTTDPVYRLRYRLILEKSLSGDQIDQNEFYIKMGSEVLWNHSSGSTDMEWRFIPLLGYELSKKSRLEMGPDYRLSDLLSASQSHMWMSVTWYVSI